MPISYNNRYNHIDDDMSFDEAMTCFNVGVQNLLHEFEMNIILNEYGFLLENGYHIIYEDEEEKKDEDKKDDSSSSGGFWGTIKDLWNKFWNWVKSLWTKIKNFFFGKKKQIESHQFIVDARIKKLGLNNESQIQECLNKIYKGESLSDLISTAPKEGKTPPKVPHIDGFTVVLNEMEYTYILDQTTSAITDITNDIYQNKISTDDQRSNFDINKIMEPINEKFDKIQTCDITIDNSASNTNNMQLNIITLKEYQDNKDKYGLFVVATPDVYKEVTTRGDFPTMEKLLTKVFNEDMLKGKLDRHRREIEAQAYDQDKDKVNENETVKQIKFLISKQAEIISIYTKTMNMIINIPFKAQQQMELKALDIIEAYIKTDTPSSTENK